MSWIEIILAEQRLDICVPRAVDLIMYRLKRKINSILKMQSHDIDTRAQSLSYIMCYDLKNKINVKHFHFR